MVGNRCRDLQTNIEVTQREIHSVALRHNLRHMQRACVNTNNNNADAKAFNVCPTFPQFCSSRKNVTLQKTANLVSFLKVQMSAG